MFIHTLNLEIVATFYPFSREFIGSLKVILEWRILSICQESSLSHPSIQNNVWKIFVKKEKKCAVYIQSEADNQVKILNFKAQKQYTKGLGFHC